MGIFLRILLVFALIIAPIPIRAADDDDPLLRNARLPDGWQEAIDLDQGYNTPRRQDEILSAKERAIVRVHCFEVPRGQVRSIESQFIDAQTRNIVFTPEGNVRVFIVDRPGIPFDALRRAGFRSTGTFLGTWMQSRSTYFVWDPNNPSASPFYVKMTRVINGQPSIVHSNAELSVRNSDLVQARLRDNPNEAAGILPEQIGTSIRLGDMDFTNIIRASEPPGGPPAAGLRLLPVHGLLGSPAHLRRFATARGMTVEQWLEREYIPKLARFTADMILNRGIFFEGHTQNLKVYVDPATGEIRRFIAIDMNDVMFDNFRPLARGRNNHHGLVQGAGGSQLYDHFVSERTPRANEPGYHWGTYGAQAIRGATSDPSLEARLAARFLEEYIRRAEEILGRALPLGENARRALTSLQSGATPFSTHPRRLGPVPAAMATVMQGIHDATTRALLPEIDHTANHFDQHFLSTRFYRQENTGEIAYLARGARERLQAAILDRGTIFFTYDGRGIIAYDLASGTPKVLGYAFNIGDIGLNRPATAEPARTPATTTSVAASASGDGFVGFCSRMFNRLTGAGQ